MKTIKSSLLGFKKLDDSDTDVLMLQIQEILSQHQEILINRLLSDLPTYLDYRFHVKATKAELDEMRSQLNFIKHKMVDLEMFPEVIAHVRANTTTHLSNEIFYTGIDRLLLAYKTNPTLTVS